MCNAIGHLVRNVEQCVLGIGGHVEDGAGSHLCRLLTFARKVWRELSYLDDRTREGFSVVETARCRWERRWLVMDRT